MAGQPGVGGLAGIPVPAANRSNTIPASGGAVYRSEPRRYMLNERVRIAASSSYKLINIQIPAQAKVVWAQVRNSGTNTITVASGAAGITPDRVALISLLPATATSSAGATTTSTQVVAFGSTTLTTADTGVGAMPLNIAAGRNNATSNAASAMAATVNGRLALIPCDGGGAQYFWIHDTATSGAYFSATADVDVQIYVEQYDMVQQS